jgi:hypothetical protein
VAKQPFNARSLQQIANAHLQLFLPALVGDVLHMPLIQTAKHVSPLLLQLLPRRMQPLVPRCHSYCCCCCSAVTAAIARVMSAVLFAP